MDDGAASHANWVYDSPVHSDVEAKLRSFLVDLRKEDKILGIQLDSLFPLFSVTKGVVAGMVHWLADKG
nr:hypothetical protein [Tanacetum cinerariifolium]